MIIVVDGKVLFMFVIGWVIGQLIFWPIRLWLKRRWDRGEE